MGSYIPAVEEETVQINENFEELYNYFYCEYDSSASLWQAVDSEGNTVPCPQNDYYNDEECYDANLDGYFFTEAGLICPNATFTQQHSCT
jgi:hypothetical protein